jgi:AcrR family transcriptional regulator
MAKKEEHPELDTKDEQLIVALLRYKTKAEAAAACGISLRTVYYRLANRKFMDAYRAALRDRFRDCLAVLERNSERSAQALVDVVDDPETETATRVVAAKAVIDRAFQAQDTIAMEDEMDSLRAQAETLRKLKTPPPVPLADTPREVRRVTEQEQTDACRLRVAWMNEIGMDAQAVDESLRYNQPQSIVEEQQNLDMVRKLLEVERMYPQPARS